MRRFTFTSLALSILLAAGCAGMPLAGDGFTDWDLDDNDLLDGDEFGVGFDDSDLYEEWDMNDDGLLDENEFGYAADDWGFGNEFGLWDTDDDGFLDDDEFGVGAFGLWDTDDDGFLDDEEFEAGPDWFG